MKTNSVYHNYCRRLGGVLLAALLAAVSTSGCGGKHIGAGAPATSAAAPARSFDATELLARLRAERGAAPKTLKASAKATVESPDLDGGKRSLRTTLLAEPPNALRFRAEGFGPIGELFQMIQIGPLLIVYFREEGGQLFVGPIDELHESAGLVRRLQPMRLLRALTMYGFLLERAGSGAWSEIDTRYVALDAPAALEGFSRARFVVNRTTLDLVRVTLEPEPARLEEALAGEFAGATAADLSVTITYGDWQVEAGGVALPRSVIVSIPEERTSITLEAIEYRIDPKLPGAAFKAPSTKNVYPLRYLVFDAPEDVGAEK